MYPVDPIKFALLEQKVENFSEVKTDVKSILATCQKLELHLEQCPTFDDLSKVKDRVVDLEKSRAEAKGAWKIMTAVGAGIGACSGAIVSIIGYFWSGGHHGK
jgi:hypothetical protein